MNAQNLALWLFVPGWAFLRNRKKAWYFKPGLFLFIVFELITLGLEIRHAMHLIQNL